MFGVCRKATARGCRFPRRLNLAYLSFFFVLLLVSKLFVPNSKTKSKEWRARLSFAFFQALKTALQQLGSFFFFLYPIFIYRAFYLFLLRIF